MEVVLIGLGHMGLAYAERLTDMGHRVIGYDISPEAMAALVALDAVPVSSFDEVADHAVPVLLSLPDAGTVEKIGEDLIAVLGGKTIPGVIDLSTTGPLGAKRLAHVLESGGIPYAEAPVTGGVSGARQGTLTLMASGSPVLLETAAPVMRHLGTVVRLGDAPGLGQTMKVLNNLLSATNLAITSEAIAAGAASGLDPAQMLDVFNSGSGKNSATMDKFGKYVLSGRFDQGFVVSLMAKDVSLAQEFLHAVGLPAWVSAAVMETWLAASRLLPASADFTEVARVHASYLFDGARTSRYIYEE